MKHNGIEALILENATPAAAFTNTFGEEMLLAIRNHRVEQHEQSEAARQREKRQRQLERHKRAWPRYVRAYRKRLIEFDPRIELDIRIFELWIVVRNLIKPVGGITPEEIEATRLRLWNKPEIERAELCWMIRRPMGEQVPRHVMLVYGQWKTEPRFRPDKRLTKLRSEKKSRKSA